MDISDVRLTLYALITSVETDLRRLIRTVIVPRFHDLSFLQDDEQRDRVVERFIRDHPELNPDTEKGDVLDYLDFSDAYQILRQNASFLPPEHAKELRERSQTLERLATVRNRVMHSRPLLAGDFEAVYAFVSDAANTSVIEWSATIQTLTRLNADPSFVLGLTLPTPPIGEAYVLHNLPVPDFDDTGFVGRADDALEIRKLLLGPNTVVSVIGEGGIGKTALLLKVLYDVVDMGNDCPFDAIIWTSAKTSALTASGIQDIQNAVSDLSGVAKGIGSVLGVRSQDTDQRLAEILDYLQEFRVLLALDNIETIVNSSIREFIRKAQFHSKLAITSRIGLGELEFRWHLQPMRKREAGALFRAHARIRNIPDLLQMKDARLFRILDLLHCNPLAIKWFVHSVQSGKSPDAVIAAKEDLLEYCMSNVYNQLPTQTQALLSAALAARTHTSEAELIYYTGMSALEVRKAINQLLATSFLQRTTRNKSVAEEIVYSVNDFAREYLIERHGPSRRLVEDVQRKRNQLMGSVQDASRIVRIDEFSVNALTPRNSSERAVCPLLRQALALSRNRRFTDAREKIREASGILPHYFEIYRVSAFIKASNNDLLGAESDYRIGLDLEPDNARLLFFYAGFLVRSMNDASTALAYAEKAFTLRPESVDTATLYARCIGYSGNYPKAIELLNHLLASEVSSTAKNKKVITTLALDFYRRQSEDERTIKKDYDAATLWIQMGIRAFDSAVRDGFVDERIILELSQLFQEYNAVIQHVINSPDQDAYHSAVREHSEYLVQAGCEYIAVNSGTKNTPSRQDAAIEDVRVGKVIGRQPDRFYAFIDCHCGERFFFHKKHLCELEDWDTIHDGSLVRFSVGSNLKGSCAIAVQVIDKYEHTSQCGEVQPCALAVQRGVVIEHYAARTFAFVEEESGRRYFFHRSAFLGNMSWTELTNGAPVSFRIGRNERGHAQKMSPFVMRSNPRMEVRQNGLAGLWSTIRNVPSHSSNVSMGHVSSFINQA